MIELLRLHPAQEYRFLPALAAILATACENPSPESVQTDVGTPPSIEVSSEGPGARLVRLTEAQARTLAIRTVTVSRASIRFGIRVPGTVTWAPDYYAEVSAPLSGRISSMAVHEGESVERGQVVARLESLELANLVSSYREEEAERRFAQLQVERYEPLVDSRISPASVLEGARAELTRATARSDAALIRLRSLGVGDQDLALWRASDVDRPLLALRSPIDGVVGEHLIELGQPVMAYEKMMSVVNTERVLVQAFLTPDDASWIRAGDSTRVVLPSMPSRAFEAAIMSVSPMVGDGSRSVVAIIPLVVHGALIPGQSVRVTVLAQPGEPVIVVPLSAVEYEGDTAVVFVRGEDDMSWIPTPVEVARLGAEEAIIGSGLEPGDVVATTQVFTLKALARFAEYGEEP
ncbi:MAG: efflux RND transporter periplasmic adaptor subunit [Gemmatimonadota bacterium]|nr:efflux RND transporter periplasmic adaptor subunit [Gemmatimonadota bacterium]MDE2864129.1 efflux RND transporter periplasmic adaptor subunit [Gemmatimonadota bacterium]